MLSKEQYLEKKAKVELVVTEFLKHKRTIYDMANDPKIGIPKSSIQRYLNDIPFIKEIYGANADFIIEEIQRRLKENKIEGNKLGGEIYSNNNISTKDDLGHFTGSRKK